MAEERNPVGLPPARTPVAPDLPGATPLTSSELDDVDVPRSADTTGLGPGGSADRIDVVAAPGTTASAGTGAIAADDTNDPDVIREQIERTREDMSQTINDRQERLSPERLKQQARDTVREATVGRVQQMVGSAGDTAVEMARRAQDAAEPVMEQVRERPVPVALLGAGAGLAWWLMRRASSRQTWSSDDMYNWDDDTNTMRTRNYDDRNRGQWQGDSGWTRVFRDNPLPASLAAASIGYMLWNQRSSSRPEHYVGTRSAYGGGFDEEVYSGSSRQGAGDSGRGMTQQAREKANELGQKASELGQKASEKASELGQKASETASEISHQVTDTVRSARQQVNRMSRNTSTQFEHWMQENPLAVGIAAMAAGAVVGLTVPVTRAENRTLGASRDALVERATDTAMQLKDQVREKVQEVAGDLTNQVSNSGSSTNPSSSPTSSTTTIPGTTGV